MIFAASRPSDDVASFRAPGYGILNLDLRSPSFGPVRWGMELNNVHDKSYVRAISGANNVRKGNRRTLRAWVELAYF